MLYTASMATTKTVTSRTAGNLVSIYVDGVLVGTVEVDRYDDGERVELLGRHADSDQLDSRFFVAMESQR